MRESPVIADRGSQPAQRDSDQCGQKHFPAGSRKKHDSDYSEDMDQHSKRVRYDFRLSAFHHGSVQGCFSTSAERSVNELPPKQNREILTRCPDKPCAVSSR